MRDLNRIRLFLMIVLLLSVNTISAQNNQIVYNQKKDNLLWFPNTLSTNYKNVVNNDDDLFFPLNSGLAKYNSKLDSLYVYHIPIDSVKSTFGSIFPARINSIVKNNNKIWVSIPNEGIWIFDLSQKQFTHKFEIEFVDEESPYSNLYLVKDPYSGNIWVSCHKTLSLYVPDRNQFINITAKIRKLGISNPTFSRYFLFDHNNVWFHTGENKYSVGSFIQYTKEQNDISIFREELSNIENPKRIDIRAMFQLKNTIFLYVSTGTAFPHIEEYDKNLKIWKTYNPVELLKIIDDLKDNYSNEMFNEIMDKSFFIKALKELQSRYKYKTDNDFQNNYFTNYSEEQIKKIKSNFATRIQGYMYDKVWDYDDLNSYLYNNQIILNNKKKQTVISQDFADANVEYRFPLFETKKGVFIITNRGLEILNLKTNTIIQIIDSSSGDYDLGSRNGTTSYSITNNKLFIFHTINGHDLMYYLFEIDLNTLHYKDIIPNAPIKHIPHRLNETVWIKNSKLYINTYNDILNFYNNKWMIADNDIKPEKTFKDISNELILENGSNIKVTNTGLFIAD